MMNNLVGPNTIWNLVNDCFQPINIFKITLISVLLIKLNICINLLVKVWILWNIREILNSMLIKLWLLWCTRFLPWYLKSLMHNVFNLTAYVSRNSVLISPLKTYLKYKLFGCEFSFDKLTTSVENIQTMTFYWLFTMTFTDGYSNMFTLFL